jgi:hypothetical protein
MSMFCEGIIDTNSGARKEGARVLAVGVAGA